MQDFKLKTKADTAAKLLELIRPLKKFYSPGKAWLKVGDIGVQYGEKVALMEGFTRILWGLGPLWSNIEDMPEEIQKEAEEWRLQYIEGLINGSNPEHEEYWGKCVNNDQKIVENAAIVVTIFLNRDKIWGALTPEQQDNLYKFIYQCNFCAMGNNNWRYFRILANKLFQTLGLPFDQARLDEDQLGIIEPSYVGEGWYFDGNSDQYDYYVPFAMHFYALLYSKFRGEEEPEYCATLKARASTFAHDFAYWFGNDGNEIGFGRSLTYRFAHSSFFGAMGLAEVDDSVDYGIMKRLTLRNIETWLARPIFDNAGVLTVGYGYANIFMSERYSAAGSPYWAFKAFIMLSLPADHPFWTAEEKDFDFEPQKAFQKPRMLIAHEDNNHVLAYISGQHNARTKGHCPEKYEKFVYSNQFSFSVPREPDLIGGAYDNILVASYAGDEHYRMRFGNTGYETKDDCIKINYKLLPDVNVKTVIVPCGAWHVRIHEIDTKQAIDIADGGFAIELEYAFTAVRGEGNGRYTPDQIKQTENSTFGVFDWGVSGVVSLSGDKPEWVDAIANTNLLYNLTGLPMSCNTLQPGKHTVITCVFGDRSETATEKMKNVPQASVKDGVITVTYNGKTVTETFLD